MGSFEITTIGMMEEETTTTITMMEKETDVDFWGQNNSTGNFTNSDDYVYKVCSAEWEIFWKGLEVYILNVDLVLCLMGIPFNILNIVVFAQKKMVNPINAILAAISLADIVVMSVFIVQYVAKLEYTRQNSPFSVAVIWIVHEFVLASFHSIAMWLNMTLALWRYIAVVFPLKSRSLCTMRRAKIAMSSIFVSCILVTVGGYYHVSVIESDQNKSWREGGCGSKYCDHWTDFDVPRLIEFLNSGILSKIVPAFVLTFVSIRLIKALVDAKENRRKMTSANDSTRTARSNQAVIEAQKEFDRTTRMLLVILVLFLVTEIPPGVLYILTIVYGIVSGEGDAQDFYFECRGPLHFITVGMYFLSGNFNFIVLTVMSKNFRKTLQELIYFQKIQKFLGIHPPIVTPQTSSASTRTMDSKV